MDAIAGLADVRSFEEEAARLGSQIREKHNLAAETYGAYKDLHKQVSQLQELRRGLRELEDANLIALRDRYQRATEQRVALHQAVSELSGLRDKIEPHVEQLAAGLAREALAAESALGDAIDEARESISAFRGTVRSKGMDLRAAAEQCLSTLQQHANATDDAFESFAEEYSRELAKLTDEQRQLLESHREVLERTSSLTVLEGQRDDAKKDLHATLEELTELCEKVGGVLDSRSELRESRVSELSTRLKQFDVRLKVARQKESVDLQNLAQKYVNGSRVLNELKSKLPERLSHLCLRRAYSALGSEISSEFGDLLFLNPELSHFLTVFENDDLEIELKVGRPGEEFTPIARLSAGQKCTAVFPILLGLEEAPLVIDQPEDNLDNRHIADKIAWAVLLGKRRRQMIFTSHNANLVVLSDSELILKFESDDATGYLDQQGFLACKDSPIAKEVLAILDGGEKALWLRAQKYGLRPAEDK